MDPISERQEVSKNWALKNRNDQGPNLDKLAQITNQTPQNIHEIMNDGGLDLNLMPLYWVPENSNEYDLMSEAEQALIQNRYTYVTNSYICDSGK